MGIKPSGKHAATIFTYAPAIKEHHSSETLIPPTRVNTSSTQNNTVLVLLVEDACWGE
jgi:hypothetical protein